MIKIAVTGHRELDNEQKSIIQQTFYKIIKLYDRTEVEFICGGAKGVDTLIAQLCYDEIIPYYLYYPFPYYDKDNEDLKPTAKSIVELYNKYEHNGQFQARNEAMCKDADILLAFYDRRLHGGTYNCIKYAKRVLLPIIEVMI